MDTEIGGIYTIDFKRDKTDSIIQTEIQLPNITISLLDESGQELIGVSPSEVDLIIIT